MRPSILISLLIITFNLNAQISIPANWTSTYNTHTVGAGTSRLLIYIAAFECNPITDLTSVTYGGVAMTLAVERDRIGYNRVEIWYLNESDISSSTGNTFTTTFSNGLPYNTAHFTYAVTLDGVDQVSPICQAESGAISGSATVSLDNSLSLLSSEMAIYATSTGGVYSHTPYSGYTENFDNTSGPGNQSGSVSHRFVGTSISENTTATFSSTPNRAVICGIRILPLGANCSSPLPIELLNFNVKPINNDNVKINWQTASEINHDYFTIERSKNGTDWENFKIIKGAGNSSSLLNYNTIDYTPYEGISYYRLKQTDFDGQFSYSNIKSFSFSLTYDKIEIYPNPTSDKITLVGNSHELEIINVYNTLGKNVSNKIVFTEYNKEIIMIDLSKLSTGTYYIKTKTTANKVYKQ